MAEFFKTEEETTQSKGAIQNTVSNHGTTSRSSTKGAATHAQKGHLGLRMKFTLAIYQPKFGGGTGGDSTGPGDC